jgi:hypothetical protein
LLRFNKWRAGELTDKTFTTDRNQRAWISRGDIDHISMVPPPYRSSCRNSFPPLFLVKEHQQPNSGFQFAECCSQLMRDFGWLVSGVRTRNAPMNHLRIARPLLRRTIGRMLAQTYYEIHQWRIWPEEFLMVLAAQTRMPETLFF